jgi:hypothetical protein
MLLMCYDPNQPVRPERENLQPQHAKLEAELRAEGVYVSGGALWPAARSKVVRGGGNTAPQSDDTRTRSNEVVGGYYIIECGEEEALSIARRIPCDAGTWIRVQAVALFHPDAQRLARLEGYVDPRLRAAMQRA